MPAWRPLDAAHSVRLLADSDPGGRVVALCLAPGLGSTPDGARLALALVRRWVEGGLEVVLADGDLGRPSLHAALGLENGSGLADLVLLGGAWEQAALATPTPGLRLIPAGGGAAAAESHAARERLADLCREVTAGGATLALFAPLGSMMAQWAVDAATDIVVLAQEHERPLEFFAFDEDRIRALVGPPAPPAPSPPPPPLEAEPGGRLHDRTSQGSFSAPPGPRRGGPATPGTPERTSRDDRPSAGGDAGIEERWAAAAALLRAQREGAAGSPTGEPDPLFAPVPRSSRVPPPAEPPPVVVHPKPTVELPPEPSVVLPPRPEVVAPSTPAAPPSAPAFGDLLADEAGSGAAELPPLPEEYAPPRRAGKRPRRSTRTWSPPPPPPEDPGGGPVDARRRGVLVRSVVAVLGVAITAGVVWVWNSSREMPPLDVRSTPLPRVGVPGQRPAGGGADSTERQEPRAEPGETGAAPSGTPPSEVTPAEAAPSSPAQPSPAAPGAARPPTPGVGEEGAPLQRFAWSVAAMGSYEAARSLVERLRRSAPERTFVIAPIVAEGRTLYRVLGGVAETREALDGLREGVAAAAGLEPARLLLRDAPLAFALEDFTDPAAASARADQLWRSGVPAYVLVVDRDDGTRIHRIYAGAYASAEEAAVLVGTLRSAGFAAARLVERRGRVGG